MRVRACHPHQRARNAVAAAKRERDAREREVAQVRGEADALEARLREAKWDAQKQVRREGGFRV